MSTFAFVLTPVCFSKLWIWEGVSSQDKQARRIWKASRTRALWSTPCWGGLPHLRTTAHVQPTAWNYLPAGLQEVKANPSTQAEVMCPWQEHQELANCRQRENGTSRWNIRLPMQKRNDTCIQFHKANHMGFATFLPVLQDTVGDRSAKNLALIVLQTSVSESQNRSLDAIRNKGLRPGSLGTPKALTWDSSSGTLTGTYGPTPAGLREPSVQLCHKHVSQHIVASPTLMALKSGWQILRSISWARHHWTLLLLYLVQSLRLKRTGSLRVTKLRTYLRVNRTYKPKNQP